MLETIKKTASLGQEAVNSLIQPFFKQRTTAVVHPFRNKVKPDKKVQPFHIQVFDYNANSINERKIEQVEDCFGYKDSDSVTWLNLEGIHKEEVEKIASRFGIHYLIKEDILSYGQRPKFDELNEIISVLLNMLFYNTDTNTIEQEQISIVLGDKFLISFQEDITRDVFDPVRQKLQFSNTKLRQYPADHLLYTMIDLIVDSYFNVIEKIGDRIEKAEDDLLNNTGKKAFNNINLIRKDLILLKRNTTPVRDLVAGILRSDNELLKNNTTKYYKDVHDHIMQANDLVDNYRDLVNTLQDMYFNNVNLRMNEVMKTLAIITSVMAPATVIGGIFGMNFDIIPYAHHQWGFYGTVAIMFGIPFIMIWWFNRRGWFKNDRHTD
jgi:magnesium transporter